MFCTSRSYWHYEESGRSEPGGARQEWGRAFLLEVGTVYLQEREDRNNRVPAWLAWLWRWQLVIALSTTANVEA